MQLHTLKNLRFIRYTKVRPRLTISFTFGAFVYFLLPDDLRDSTRLLIACDSTTALYLVLASWMMAHSDVERISRRAAIQDEGRLGILSLMIMTVLASLYAILGELGYAKEMHTSMEAPYILLTALTVLLSWIFMHTIFALHYANEYYTERKGAHLQGLDFPGTDKPDYWDFTYFSFILGTAAQTADVRITSKKIRNTVTLHCITAFFFNTTILALTINISAGLF